MDKTQRSPVELNDFTDASLNFISPSLLSFFLSYFLWIPLAFAYNNDFLIQNGLGVGFPCLIDSNFTQ